jgi:flavin-dependent dehydrogenase
MGMMAADVAIIGGGPAGASAAFHLAKAGLHVVVIESRTFPRLKVCGEYISPAATDCLEAMIPRSELVRAGARSVGEFVLALGHRQVVWPTPRPAWALSRSTLDDLLLAKARAAGAEVLQPATARTVAYNDEIAAIQLADGSELKARLVIHADGFGRHDPHGAVPLASGLLGCKCHFNPPPGVVQGVSMHSCEGMYVGTICLEGSMATCALAVRQSLLKACGGDVDAMLNKAWPEYRSAWRTTGWKVCGIPKSRYIHPGHPRSLRIGNAAGAVDPIGGEGIGLALWSGSLAASLIAAEGDLDVPALRRCEHRLGNAYRRRLRARLPACSAAASLLMRPRLLARLWPLLRMPSLTLGRWYALTGKPA